MNALYSSVDYYTNSAKYQILINVSNINQTDCDIEAFTAFPLDRSYSKNLFFVHGKLLLFASIKFKKFKKNSITFLSVLLFIKPNHLAGIAFVFQYGYSFKFQKRISSSETMKNLHWWRKSSYHLIVSTTTLVMVSTLQLQHSLCGLTEHTSLP